MLPSRPRICHVGSQKKNARKGTHFTYQFVASKHPLSTCKLARRDERWKTAPRRQPMTGQLTCKLIVTSRRLVDRPSGSVLVSCARKRQWFWLGPRLASASQNGGTHVVAGAVYDDQRTRSRAWTCSRNGVTLSRFCCFAAHLVHAHALSSGRACRILLVDMIILFIFHIIK